MIAPILAIGRNTFQEAIRSNIFIICLVVLAILCAFAPMFPSINDPSAKLKLALSISLQLCYYFGLIIIIFTSAAFLPDEINSKRIYTIFPKPVSRVQYLLGKLLGICLLSFCLLFVFAIIVIAFVRLTYNSMPEEAQKAGKPFFSTINTFSVNTFKRFRNKKEVGEVPAHAFEVSYKNLNFNNYDDKISLKILTSYVKPEASGKIWLDITMIDEDSKAEIVSLKDVRVRDKKLFTIPCPFPKEVSLNQYKNILIRVSVALQSQPFVGGVSIKENDFYFHRKSEPLELNILKAFFIFAIQFTLLGFVAVAASTRMSYYIASMFALTAFAAGSFSGFLKDYVVDKQEKIELKIIDGSSLYEKFSHVMDQYMQMICSIMPNFSKYDISGQIIDGISLNYEKMFEITSHFGLYLFVYLFLASFMIWKREV